MHFWWWNVLMSWNFHRLVVKLLVSIYSKKFPGPFLWSWQNAFFLARQIKIALLIKIVPIRNENDYSNSNENHLHGPLILFYSILLNGYFDYSDSDLSQISCDSLKCWFSISQFNRFLSNLSLNDDNAIDQSSFSHISLDHSYCSPSSSDNEESVVWKRKKVLR